MEKKVNPIIAKIEAKALEKGYTSLTAFSKDAGLADTTLTKKRFSPGGPNQRTLEKVAAKLECKPSDFLEPPPQLAFMCRPPLAALISGEVRTSRVKLMRAPDSAKTLPVQGTAASSTGNGFEISDKVIEYVRRPPGLEGVEEAYAIYVVGDSMAPEHKPGDLRFVHPHRQCRPGDTVIIQTRLYETTPIQAYIKTLVREKPEEIVARQLNPATTMQYKRPQIVAMHKVLTMNDLFGV